MQALAIRITESDTRYFKVDPAFKIGHYLESVPGDRPATLVVGRIPTATQAPKGRLPTAVLQRLIDDESKVAQPQVIARFPRWSTIANDGLPIEVPDDTECEPVTPLPPSLLDKDGLYVQPPNAYEPLAEQPAEKAEKAEPEASKKAAAEKAG